ncbi:hypothetical protein [Acinetobacter bereziniae]|uniref:hypothetical protein n=1 Tax=Acinetobacter bereziniae TaxID=106648 RepID=UPI001250A58C|nr:hypothetical protein [Acinetobacter bereziniae]
MDVLQIKNGDSLTIKLKEGDTLKLFTNTIVIAGNGAVSAVQSVNAKTGHIVLKADDVGADQKGSAITVKQQLSQEIQQVKTLAETNQLNLTQKVDIHDFELTQEQVELNRLVILSKADITALSMLAVLVNTKADQVYVQEQIANLVNGDQSIINAIQEITKALEENEGLLEALDYTVANRVRFDIATQALTALQKSNARTNIGAEEIGTAALLISQITLDSLGAATKQQGELAESALQSADVAPVALSGSFSSLNAQDKIFDVPFSAYSDGENSEITALDSLGVMLRKLQKQIKSLGGSSVEWVRAEQIGVVSSKITPFIQEANNTLYLEFAKIGGLLWVRGGFTVKDLSLGAVYDYHTEPLITLFNDYKMQALVAKGGMLGYSPNGSGWWMQTQMNVIRPYNNNGGTRLLFWSDRAVLSAEQALDAKQELVCSNGLYSYDVCFICPSPLGILVE